MKNEVITKGADKVKRKKRIKKILKRVLLVLILLLFILYIVFSIIYSHGSFTIRLERDLYLKNSIIVYEDPDYKVFRTELYAQTMDFIDNIKGEWFDIWWPDGLDKHEGGSHNGENYVAYTFYVENLGDEVTDYYTEIIVDDVLKGVDEAIRVRVYRNGEVATYAKMGKNGQPEKDTIPFVDDVLVARNWIQEFKPGDIDKYTIVFWLEGPDPECNDNILGGEFKFHMDFKSEVIQK